jgi:probable FeS assembly SUF system protein SufT
MSYEATTITRDIDVTEIPSGYRGTLPAGKSVRIVQTLGGNFTVMTDEGAMLRVDGKDADAIGQSPIAALPPEAGKNPEGQFSEQAVWDQLKTVYDPEIPVDIVSLGLVYNCDAKEHPQGGKRVDIKMSMTAPGCGMGDVLRQDILQKVAGLPGVREVNVDVVFDPPWHPEMMSEAAKLKLGFM